MLPENESSSVKSKIYLTEHKGDVGTPLPNYNCVNCLSQIVSLFLSDPGSEVFPLACLLKVV